MIKLAGRKDFPKWIQVFHVFDIIVLYYIDKPAM